MNKALINFKEMPFFLKILTLLSLCSIFFIFGTLIPGGAILGQRKVQLGEWWSNGSGAILTFALGVFFSSALLMLKRIQYARVVYLVGWVLLYINVFIIELINDVSYSFTDYFFDIVFGLFQLVIFWLYFFLSKGVKSYFLITHYAL